MPNWLKWTAGAGIVLLLAAVPTLRHRAVYAHAKRLREVTPGRVYRSGQLTADGFAEAVARHGIRTVVNLQDEFPDPDVERGFLGGDSVRETELCRQLGVRYVYIQPDLLSRRRTPTERPRAIEDLLALLDTPAAYPVLIHCKAGLHRTGCMVAVYRMEYEGWSPQAALTELRQNGFGQWACQPRNDYIAQYVLSYRPGQRPGRAADRAAVSFVGD